jgi:hypothetical protein
VTSETAGDVDGCELRQRYSEAWQSAFRGIGWSRTSAEAPLRLEHEFHCDAIDLLNIPKYNRMWNSVTLKEPNFVFVFNGRVVRKLAVIHSWNVLATADRNATGRILDAIENLYDQVQGQIQELRVRSTAPAGRP